MGSAVIPSGIGNTVIAVHDLLFNHKSHGWNYSLEEKAAIWFDSSWICSFNPDLRTVYFCSFNVNKRIVY